MKVGIIVYSETGNTLSVAEMLLSQLKGNNLDVGFEEIKLGAKYCSNKPFEIVKAPTIDNYDLIVLGSPVEAFSPSIVIKKYLDGITSFENKDVCLLVTQFFPFPWMGGNRTLKLLEKEIVSKGGNVVTKGVVNWSNKKRNIQKTKVVSEINGYVMGGK